MPHSGAMQPIERVHGEYVQDRRVRVLVSHIAPLLPPDSQVLDVGAGDGQVAAALMAARPDTAVVGIDPLVRPDTRIPVHEFDGEHIPFEADLFDAVTLIDVLHHADDAPALLREASRVTRGVVIIKDHNRDGFLAAQTLRFMDAVGNRRYGVALPYNYRSRAEWQKLWRELGLEPEQEIRKLGLYPWPASLLFDRGLHFVARLRPMVS
jgi:ubiquinone/menaquinone biosynthesis C-methylase UbiE